MHNKAIIENAISTLANSMRIYGEAQFRFGELFKVDPEEAIDNVDRAFEATLGTFHTLYDQSKDVFPYFDHGDTALIIAVRNAIQHRNHPLFRSLSRHLHLEDGGIDRLLGASYLLASHPTRHGAPIPMKHHFRLGDIDARLDPSRASPYLDVSIRGQKAIERFALIDRELSLQAIRQFSEHHGFGNQTYINLMPIFVSAVCKVFKAMKATGIDFVGFDAETYAVPFTSELDVDLGDVEFSQLKLAGWGPLDLIPQSIDVPAGS